MEYQEPVKDFAHRTRHNLELIQKQSNDGNKAYEVTQLINSMLGLLVFPQQHYFDLIPKTPLNQLKNQGWPQPFLEGSIGGNGPKNLKDLVRYLRNGITHFNMEFLSEEGGTITGVRVWNHEDGKRDNPKNWSVDLKLNDLDLIAKKFVESVLAEK